MIKSGFAYEIKIPTKRNSYSNNLLCSYSLPPPEGYYTYLFPDTAPYSIEQSSTSACRCLDSLLYEHTEEGITPIKKEVLSCGDAIDKRLDGKMLTSNISITFRSNGKVKKSGATFLIYENSATVRKLASVLLVQFSNLVSLSLVWQR